MIQITPHMRITVMVEAADFRKGIDSLAAICRKVLSKDPFSGNIFVFRNRKKTAIKLLVYDGQGFWLLHKRLSKGKFSWWPEKFDAASVELAAYELQLLIYSGDPTGCEVGETWRKIKNDGSIVENSSMATT